MAATQTLEELEAAVKAAVTEVSEQSHAQMAANTQIDFACCKWDLAKHALDEEDKVVEDLKRKRDEITAVFDAKRKKLDDAKKAVMLHPTKLAERRADAPNRIKNIYNAWADESTARVASKYYGVESGTVGDMLGAYMTLLDLDLYLQEPFAWRNDQCILVLATEDLRKQIRVHHGWGLSGSGEEKYMSETTSTLDLILDGYRVFTAEYERELSKDGSELQANTSTYLHRKACDRVPEDLRAAIPVPSMLTSDKTDMRFLHLLLTAFPIHLLRVSPGKGPLAKLVAADVPLGGLRGVRIVPDHPKPKPQFNCREDYGMEATE